MRIQLFILLLTHAGFSQSGGGDFYAAELITVPGGTFQMGSGTGDKDEKPVRAETVKDFQIGGKEVTLGWYLKCMSDGVCEAPSWWSIGYFESVHDGLSPKDRMNLPVTGVSWRQAMSFCKWLGPGYSLPSEAEWEYAAGAGKNWIYPWGNQPEDRFAGAARQKVLAPVGSSKANPLGLYDMGGNVWEWVLDCYPGGGSSETCERRVSKGGSWSEHVWNLRVANKSYGLEDQGYKGLGFRVVHHAQ